MKGVFLSSYVFFVLSFFIREKLVMLEFIGVLQLGFFSLVNNSSTNIYMNAFNFYFINGFNGIRTVEEEDLPQHFE